MSKKKLANASQIVPGLWIGDEKVSQDPRFFQTKAIGAVLNCTPDVPHKFCNDNVEYMRLTLGDSQHPDDIERMEKYLSHAASFIQKNKDVEGKIVLVHCHQGIQRSCSAVTAYLMKEKGMSLKQVINFLSKRRKQAFYGGTYLTFKGPLTNFEKKQC